MPSRGRDELTVYVDALDLGPIQKLGTLRRDRAGGRAVFSFAFEPAWLRSRAAFPIDPRLGLYEGEQALQELPGIFADASPDRWGRVLMERREAVEARAAGRRPRGLDNWDFLAGVNDATRMGGLRLARPDGAFVDDSPLTVPPTTQLRELEHWARLIEEGAPPPVDAIDKWKATLIAPGSSLGGNRPKTTFSDVDGSLWIGKFPSRQDRRDVGAWEYILTRLAAACAITVPESRLLRLASQYRTFAARRFDRTPQGRRLYASAMTLTARRDHDDATYLDIAEAITNFGEPARIDADLEQLFRRAVFNVLASNRDDHLRNHGFLRDAGGWRLAPAFDMNPSLEATQHTLGLSEGLHMPDVRIVLETADLYRLSSGRAVAILEEVRRAVAGWRDLARETQIDRDEIDLMSTAFEAAASAAS